MTLINKALRPLVEGIHENVMDLFSIVEDYKGVSWVIGLLCLLLVDVVTYMLVTELCIIPFLMTFAYLFIGLLILTEKV